MRNKSKNNLKNTTKSKLHWPSLTDIGKNFCAVIIFTIIFTSLFYGADILAANIQKFFL